MSFLGCCFCYELTCECEYCEVCGKVLDEDKGELAHGCLDCHMDPKADKVRTLMKENADLKERNEFLDDKIDEYVENLKAAQDQNHYLKLMGEYRDKFYAAEEELKKLQRKYSLCRDRGGR